MRNFHKLDPVSLKAFYYAAETLNFTKAADAAALTQSGVSQHIAHLEEELGVDLFVRANRKVKLTAAGARLKLFAEQYLDRLDELLENVQSEGQNLKGSVRYAMPSSCLMTPHFPLLLEARKRFPDVDLQVKLCHSEEVVELLIAGDIDFGFITKKLQHKDIQYEEFAREEYVLVSHQDKTVQIKDLRDLKNLDCINYPGMDILFEHWQQTYFARHQHLQIHDLNIRGSINSLNGAIIMATHGVGCGIFPRHCVEPELHRKKLFAYKGEPSRRPDNPIYIIQLNSKFPTARIHKVLETFRAMKR